MFILEQTVNAKHDLYSIKAVLRHRVSVRGYDMRFGQLSADVEVSTPHPAVFRAIAARLKERAKRGSLRVAMKQGDVGGITSGLGNCHIVSASKLGNVLPVIPAPQSSMLPAACGPLKQLYCHDNDVKLSSPPARRSPAGAPPAASPDAPVAGLAADASHADTQAWLARQRLPQHAASFADFCGADLLRLSRDDLIQICGLADGIRLFNALRSKRIEPRLTVYVCAVGGVYTAVYLNGCTAAELLAELLKLSGSHETVTDTLLVTGPGETRVYVTDELVRHLPDNSTFRLQRLDGALLLTPTHH